MTRADAFKSIYATPHSANAVESNSVTERHGDFVIDGRVDSNLRNPRVRSHARAAERRSDPAGRPGSSNGGWRQCRDATQQSGAFLAPWEGISLGATIERRMREVWPPVLEAVC
jgi:hypothetical protein